MKRKLLGLLSLGVASGLFVAAMCVTASATPGGVPEIDPGTASGGLALLGGVVLLVGQRLRRR